MTAKTPGACAALRIVSKALGSLILVCQHTLAAFYEANCAQVELLNGRASRWPGASTTSGRGCVVCVLYT